MSDAGTPREIRVPDSAPTPAPAPQVNGSSVASLATTTNPRLAPQDNDAERSVLGGVLLMNESLFDITELVKPEDFYREPHRRIFEAMQALALRSEPIDIITLADELKRSGHLEGVLTPAFIASLDAAVPATSNLTHYAKIVRDKAIGRRLAEAGHGIARVAYDQKGDVRSQLDEAQRKLSAIADNETGKGLEHIKVSLKRRFEELERRSLAGSEITGLCTGFDELDQLLAGLQPADLIIIGGRPSMGKTSFAMAIAGNVAIRQGRPVGVFSLEMSKDSLTDRMLGSESGIDGQRIRTGRVGDTEWHPIAKAADGIYKAPLYIDDDAGTSILEIRSRARRLRAQEPDLALIVIDYLQLMRSPGGDDDRGNREQEISAVSRGLKALGKEMKIPIIALSQLNRALEKRDDKRPVISDLRESGAIEQDADVIMFLYREEVYDKESKDRGLAEVIIAKQRCGPTATVKLAFDKHLTRFDNRTIEVAPQPTLPVQR